MLGSFHATALFNFLALRPSKNASMRFFICASETTRLSIMSDSMKRHGISRACMKARRPSARPVETGRQLLVGGEATPPPPHGEQLVEAAEDGVTRDADEDQAVFLLLDRANPMGGLVGHLLDQLGKVLAPFCGAAKRI